MTSGLVIGKFMPPHRGHLSLIEVARTHVDELNVLLCSDPREPIPGELREAWLRELLPGVTLHHLRHRNPAYPQEDPDFWPIWQRSIREFLPSGPDLVFSSEDYGDELARRLGARHVCVDRDRRRVPVSGSQIRAQPLRHWESLPECVRPYYVRRLALVGPESTGKTTLAEQLAAACDTRWVPEYARGYLDVKNANLPPGAPICEPADLPEIVRGQIASEEALARQANRVLVCDTTPLVTAVYSQHYFGNCPEWLERAARRCYDRYLLLDIDVPWIADPQRDRPHLREHMYTLFRDGLVSRGFAYRAIHGNWPQRAACALAELQALL